MATLRNLVGVVAWLLPVLAGAVEDRQLAITDSGKRAAVQDLVRHCLNLSIE